MPRRRLDPTDTPIDGRPDHSVVDGKRPDFYYVWEHRDDVRKRLTESRVPGTKIPIQPFVRCEKGKEQGEEFAGYESVAGPNDSPYIENRELVLLKRPYSEQEKIWAAQEDVNSLYDKRLNGDVAGIPKENLRASVTETIVRNAAELEG